MPKALLHLIPRDKAGARLQARLSGEVARLRAAKAPGIDAVNFLAALENDPLGARSAYAATIEVRGGSSDDVAQLLEGVGHELDDVVHADLSTVLIGEEQVFVSGPRAPVRYQYLMRRSAEFDRATYLKRYREVHSQFGIKTPGIFSYVQFYVDAEASRRLAASSGFGVWGVDSVSELHLASVEEFLAEVVNSDAGAEATADERHFVDRKQSVYFCSSVEWEGAEQT